MAKFIQIVPVKIDNPADGSYYIRLYALDDAGDVWEYKYLTMTHAPHWQRMSMDKED